MATSKFNDLRLALVTLISPITDVVIAAYPPVPAELTREDRVWIGTVRSEQDKLTMGPSGYRSEDLELTLVVYAPRHGAEWPVAEARAEAILAAIEADIRTDDTVGGTVMNADVAVVEQSFLTDPGPVVMIEVTVTAEANL